MRILVTGGGGYVGCHLTPMLIERGHEVVVFDRFCFGEERLSPQRNLPGLTWVRGDIRRLREHPTLLDGVEAIIHLAGLSNDPSCDLDADMAIDVNVAGTRDLTERARAAGVRRFVFASSCSVYGKGVSGLLDEESATNPVSTYARGKLDCEKFLLPLSGPDFEVAVGRPATLFGWSPRMRFDLAINQMAATAVRLHLIRVYGGGRQWRPFLHVRDVARAFMAMAEAPAAQVEGEVFNVGSDRENYAIVDLAQRIQKLIPGVEIEEMLSDEDLRNYSVNFSKIQRVLGFTPSFTMEDGVREIRQALEDASIDPFDDIYFNVRWMKRLLATPVSEGGEPIAPRFIPLAPPCLGEEEESAVIDVIRSGWLTSGAKVTEFEKSLAEVTGAPYAVAVSSCTAALHLCLVHAGVKPGDDVITPPITWASTANTITNMGARMVFADIDPATLNVDPRAIEAAITPRTRAIIPVDLAGQPCDLAAIQDIGRRHGIAVIEDAAHALGADYKGTPIGSVSPYTCFSFYPVKNITTIEGGAITCADEETARGLRLLAHNGMAVTAWGRYGQNAPASPPEVVQPGFKYNMTNVGAAMGIEQLRRLHGFIAARRRLAQRYRTLLEDIEEIELPQTVHEGHAWHLMVVRLRLDRLTMTRDEIAQAMIRENVEARVHFLALHLHQYYRETLGVKPEDLPHATAASMSVLSLPLHPRLTDKNVQESVDTLKKILYHCRKK